MINTARLFIRPLSYSELSRHIESPRELADELGFLPSRSLTDKETREAILNDLLPFMADSNRDPLFYTMWIVVERMQKAIIGGICFHGEPDVNGEVEIGYGIDDGFRNKGYATETIAGIIHWVKNNRKVRGIRAETDFSNIASMQVLKKNGFQVVQQNEKVILKLELNGEIIEPDF